MNLLQDVFKIVFTTCIVTSLPIAITQSQTNIQQPQNVEQPFVKLTVLVTDVSGRPVYDLKEEEFRVFENDVPQTISFFSKEELPLLYGIVIDNSGSFKNVLKPAVNAAKIIINQNKPSDETLLIRFIDSSKIETVKDFTSDKAALSSLLDTLYIEGGESAVIDAVYLTAQRISQYRRDDAVNRRRAIVLMTDGEDRTSYYKKEQLIEMLRKENIQVFILGIVNVLEDWNSLQVKSPREKATNLINGLAKESGGLAFFPKSPTELQKIANELTLFLRSQYVVGYTPASKESQKPYRKVNVKLTDVPEHSKYIVTTRSGYTVSPKR